jgi:Arc/MetJ-type ribon-helix-helix transcriptional regulator
MVQLVNLKLQEGFLAEIDQGVKQGLYASRAEFIRDAVRRLILELKKQQALMMLEANFGKGKGKTSVLDEKRKQEIFEEYMRERQTSSGFFAKKPPLKK